jgi:raffinose/stachyose/melibiose transport system substrate-binding protein
MMSILWQRLGMSLVVITLTAAFTVPVQMLPAAPVSAAQDEATIEMWFDTTGGAEVAECIVANVVEPFNEQNDGVTVEATLQANSWQATRTAVAGGGGPDIVSTPGPSWAVELARAGQLVPLEDFVTQFGWDERFVPWALDLGRLDGTLYSLPTQQETMVLYYNKTLFDEKGWELPATLDELTALAEQIAAEGIIPFAHGNQEWRPANHWYLGEFLNQVAGPQKVYDFLSGNAQLTDEEFVQAVDMLTQYQQNGWFMGGLENYYTTTSDEMHAALGDGEAAMLMEGTWFLAEIDAFFGEAAGNANEWGWVPVPSIDGEPTFDLGIGSTYSINPASPNVDAAAAFLDYLFSPEAQARFLIECGIDPAPVTIDASALEGVDPRHVEVITALNEAAAAGNYGYLMWTFFAPKVDTFLTENVERVWAGEMTSQELLAEAQAIHDEEMAAGGVPPIPTRGG